MEYFPKSHYHLQTGGYFHPTGIVYKAVFPNAPRPDDIVKVLYEHPETHELTILVGGLIDATGVRLFTYSTGLSEGGEEIKQWLTTN